MLKGPIDRWWAGGIMSHQNNLSEIQLLDNSMQIPFLILSGIRIPVRFIGAAPAEKIKGDDPSR
jgi:hypothetical protein